jgi:hypothetical protein
LKNEILEVKADVEAREEEAMRLQREIEDAKRQLEVFYVTENLYNLKETFKTMSITHSH